MGPTTERRLPPRPGMLPDSGLTPRGNCRCRSFHTEQPGSVQDLARHARDQSAAMPVTVQPQDRHHHTPPAMQLHLHTPGPT